MSPLLGADYAREQASSVQCVPLLVETIGGLSSRLSPQLVEVLRAAVEWRQEKLTSTSEYDETT